METNFIYMTQINNKAHKTIMEMENKKALRQINRALNNDVKIRIQKRKTFLLVLVLMLISMFICIGLVLETETKFVQAETVYDDPYTIKGIVTQATETGCLIETFDELDGEQWYWESPGYKENQIVTMEMDGVHTLEIDDDVIIDVY